MRQCSMIRRNLISSFVTGSVAVLLLLPAAAGAQTSPGGAAPSAIRGEEATDATKELIQLQRNPANWPMQAGNYAGWRYSPLHQINRNNVKDLRIGWQVSTGVLRGHEGGPLVIDGMLYFQ